MSPFLLVSQSLGVRSFSGFIRDSPHDLALLVFHPSANTASGDTREPLPLPNFHLPLPELSLTSIFPQLQKLFPLQMQVFNSMKCEKGNAVGSSPSYHSITQSFFLQMYFCIYVCSQEGTPITPYTIML